MLISIYLFFASFRSILANFIKTRCMVTSPSCSSELEFPRVILLAMDSFALQMIGVDEYERSKQIMMLENIKIARILLSLNETILKLMETHDAFMIVCPKRVQLRVSWRDSQCPKWNKHPCLHKNITTLRKS